MAKDGGQGKALVLVAAGVLMVGLVVGVRAKGLVGGEEEGARRRPARSSYRSESRRGELGDLIEPRPTLPLDEFVINLADSEEIRFLKMALELELADESDKEPLTKLKPQLRDTVIRTASRRTLMSLITAGGKDRLKKELKREINQALGADIVTEVYFTAFAMQ